MFHGQHYHLTSIIIIKQITIILINQILNEPHITNKTKIKTFFIIIITSPLITLNSSLNSPQNSYMVS